MIEREWIIVAIASLGSILFALTTYLHNPRRATNIWFAAFSVAFSFYLVFNQLSVQQTVDSHTLFWIRASIFCTPFIVYTFFVLVFTFPQNTVQMSKNLLVSSGIVSAIVGVLSLTPLIFSSVVPGTNQPIPGPLSIVYVFYNFIFLGTSIVHLVTRSLRSTGQEKLQVRFFLFATILLFVFILFTNVVLVIFFKISEFVTLVPFYTLGFISILSYAIIKHKFLDINWLVARAVSYTIVLLLVAFFYAFGMLVFGRVLLGEDLTMTLYQQIILLLVTLIIAFSFKYLERLVQKITMSVFYKNNYEIDVELSSISKMLASTYELEEIIRSIKNKIDEIIHPTGLIFIVMLKTGPTQYSFGIKELVSEDLEKFITVKEQIHVDRTENAQIKLNLQKNNLNGILPLRIKNQSVGYIVLGEKQSGETYSEQDIQFLNILSDTLAVAFENARSYMEIKKFNITLQHEVETATKELRDANVQLQDLDKLKDEFVSLASHELRTPMAAIKGSLSTILEGYAGPISDETRDFLAAAYNENDRLIRLVNNLLNTSRIETGRLNFTLSEISMDSLVQEVVHNLQIAVKEKHIYLRHESVGNIPNVRADEDKVKEVVINLIANAIKFTSQGGITIKTEVKDKMVLTSVADTGTGIHQEDFDLLFKKFSQVKRDQKYTKTYGGTGLGLYLSQKIIEGLGGKIWLDSEVGKGTTFYFTLPLAR